MIRVARPRATIALASWSPKGFIGELFGVISSHLSPPAGVRSPMLWGTEEHLGDLFGAAMLDIASAEQTQSFRFASSEEFVDFFRRWYGPTHKAFAALDDLAQRWDENPDGGADHRPEHLPAECDPAALGQRRLSDHNV